MGFLTSIFERRGQERRANQWLTDWISGGGASHAGIAVNEDKALQYAAWFACVRVIAETVSTLPFKVFRADSDGKTEAKTHPAYYLLHDAPNDEMPACAFREAMTAAMCMGGNAYAEIQWLNNGNAYALHLLDAGAMRVERDRSGALRYVYSPMGQQTTVFDPSDILHPRGFSTNGVLGMSPTKLAKESLGLGMAQDRFAATFFGNGAHASGVLETPAKLDIAAIDRLKKSWRDAHSGDKTNSVAVLEQGLKYSKTSIPPEEAQFLESRQFQIEDIARWFRMPLHKIGHLAHATFSNIEHQSIEFVTDCLRPWLVRWEQECNRKLFTAPGLYCEHVVDGLLRGDIAARYSAYATGRQWGWLSVNDVRRIENLNSVADGGDVYLQPLNMVKLGTEAVQQSAPPPPPQDDQSAQNMRNAMRIALTDAAARIVGKESKALSRASAKGDASAAAAAFFASHAEHVESVLSPCIRAACVAAGKAYDSKLARDIAARWVSDASAGVRSALEAGQSLDTVLDDREAEVPQRVAADILNEVANV